MTDTQKLYIPRKTTRPGRRDGTHLYTVSDDGENYESLCDHSDEYKTVPVFGFQTPMTHVNPESFDRDIDTICEHCTQTDEYRRKFTMNDESAVEDTADTEDEHTQTRWERYQQWIDDHDWGNDKSPGEILDEGKILVSPGYQRRDIDYERKLHAYDKPDDGVFTPKCGISNHAPRPDDLEGMDPKAFMNRSEACENCASKLDSEPLSGAATIDFDPFNIFDYGKRDTELPDLPEEPEEYVCPDCGDSYSPAGIGQHWGHPKSSCEYPVPDEREQEILCGLWLAGGSIEQKGTHPVLRKTSIRKYPLEWLKHELGVWGTDVTESNSRSEQQKNVEQGFGITNTGSHQQYRLTTRTCPYLSEFVDRDVSSVELTPMAARILFSFRGHVVGNSAITIRHPDGRELVDALHRVGFTEVSLYEPSEGKNQWRVTLSAKDSRRFSEWIGGEPLPGITQRSKKLSFRDLGVQGDKPSRRVPVPDSASEDNSKGEEGVVETVSLEPDWEWLGVCLAKLGHTDLSQRAFDEDLAPNEVYGGVLDAVYENRGELPTPQEVSENKESA